MLGKILKIDGKIIKVENLKKISLINIIGYYVIFENQKQKLVGEIIFVNEAEFQIVLIGEIKNNTFIPGVENFPTIESSCRVIYKEELEYIIGSQDVLLPQNLLLGKSNIFDGFNISVHINDLFSNHFAVVGNTGSGKSCGVARLFQNMFAANKKNPTKSHFIVFDAYGEYKSAFAEINTYERINVKNYTTSNEAFEAEEIIKIPPYLLEADDLALLLNLSDPELINTIEKTLTYVYIFKNNNELCNKYKNDIIAKAFLDMLSSGKPAQQLRDQALAFLAKFHTNEINSETVIVQPGYNRTIRQCLNIDAQGKLSSLEILVAYLKQYSEVDLDKIAIEQIEYTLDDLYYALEFAIVSEGSFTSNTVNEKLNILKTRLYSIITGDKRKYFEYEGFISRNDYVKKIFTALNGESAQIVDVSFKDIDDRFAKVIVKVLSKIFYKFSTGLSQRGSFPINIIIEEAHRYIQKDGDIDVIGYNIFDRIAKEGRKYGLILGLITQRICELSSSALSQCSNFIIFRMYYPEDIKIITSISSNVTVDDIEKVKSLRPGAALLFGTAFKIPLITTFDLPNPMPTSMNIDLYKNWYEQ